MTERRQVVGEVGAGIDERVADTGLRRKVDDLPEGAVAEQARCCPGVGEIGADEPEPRLAHEPREPRLLEGYVVIRVEVVDPGHLTALREERERRVHADETRAAGHQN